jgi:hypothetical protein
LLGIAETYTDIFYIIATNLTIGLLITAVPGSGSVWRIDMTTYSAEASPFAETTDAIRKIADFPHAIGLNGMTVLNREAGLLLIADLFTGSVWRLNVNTGEVSNVITDDPLMAAKSLGIDGVYIRDQTLYFTDFGSGCFGEVELNADGTAAGNSSLIASGISLADFTFDGDRDAFIADGTNKIAFMPPHGGRVNIAQVPGPTAAQFGRTPLDSGSVYVAISGGHVSVEAGNATIGGSISRIDAEAGGH